jgi:hypothetical protein
MVIRMVGNGYHGMIGVCAEVLEFFLNKFEINRILKKKYLKRTIEKLE